MTLYHVTETKNIPRIRKQGLRTLQTSNWVNGRAHVKQLVESLAQRSVEVQHA